MFLSEILHRENHFIARSANLDDIPELLTLEQQAFPFEERWNGRDFREEIGIKPERIKIVKDGKKIIGYIQFQIGEGYLKMEQEFNESDGIIGSIAVVKKYRERGLGEYLLKTAIDELKSQGAPKIIANTRPNNTEMLNLLNKTGFQKVGITSKYYRSGQDSINFELAVK